MKLSAPKKITWWIAVIVGIVGLVLHFVNLLGLGFLSFWLVLAAFVLLALATFIKGL